jgi:hypothetical protein
MFAHLRTRSASVSGQGIVSIQRRDRLSRYAPARLLAISAAFLATGCASFSPDGGMDVVKGIARAELNSDVVALRTEDQANAAGMDADRLLKRPLTATAAVQIALLRPVR